MFLEGNRCIQVLRIHKMIPVNIILRSQEKLSLLYCPLNDWRKILFILRCFLKYRYHIMVKILQGHIAQCSSIGFPSTCNMHFWWLRVNSPILLPNPPAKTIASISGFIKQYNLSSKIK